MRALLSSTLLTAALALASSAAAIAIPVEVQLHDAGAGGFGFHVLPEEMNARVGDTMHLHVVVSESDQTVHDLVVCGDVVPVKDKKAQPPSSCRDKWAFTVPIDVGSSRDINFTVPKSGDFAYYCDIPGHAQGGMSGTLHVAGSTTSPTKSSPTTALIGTLVALVAVALARRR